MSTPNHNNDIVNKRIRAARGAVRTVRAGGDKNKGINKWIREGASANLVKPPAENTAGGSDPEPDIDKELAAAIAQEIKEGRK